MFWYVVDFLSLFYDDVSPAPHIDTCAVIIIIIKCFWWRASMLTCDRRIVDVSGHVEDEYAVTV